MGIAGKSSMEGKKIVHRHVWAYVWLPTTLDLFDGWQFWPLRANSAVKIAPSRHRPTCATPMTRVRISITQSQQASIPGESLVFVVKFHYYFLVNLRFFWEYRNMSSWDASDVHGMLRVSPELVLKDLRRWKMSLDVSGHLQDVSKMSFKQSPKTT